MQQIVDFIIRFKEYITLVALIIISMSLISLGDLSRIGGFRTVLVGAFSWFSETFSIIPNTNALKNENKALRDLNLTLSNEITFSRKALLENDNLKEMLALKDNSSYKYEPASVVERTTIEMRNYFMIDKGSKAGICAGMAVRTASNLIGIVSGTTSNYSMVEGMNNREIKVSAKTERVGVDGLIVWEGGDKLIFRNVPTSYDVKIGDNIVTSDMSSRFPSNIPIGKVTSKKQEVGNLFTKIEVTPYMDLSDVQQVFVIKHIKDPEREHLINRIDQLIQNRKFTKK